ncbi:MAG: glycosyltransferase family 4 protein [Treponema sp.]|nr:glycosyltransferase family 4 protein [Treponema sp.]
MDVRRFHPVSVQEKNRRRETFGFGTGDFIILYTAEFTPNKNHALILQQIPRLRRSIPNIRILFAGKGELQEACAEYAAGIYAADIVHFLGYRNDMEIICQIADVYVSPSKREGLAVSNLEAMACGLPLICSKIRGAIDIITEGRNGFFFELDEPDRMAGLIITLYKSPELRETISRYNAADVQKFSVDTAIANMAGIYKQFM